MQVTKGTAVRIIDALALAIDKKRASAKTFDGRPADPGRFGNWQDAKYSTTQDTPRTRALLLAYAMFSGGKLPKEGIRIDDHWFHPDIWVMKAMLNKGYMIENAQGSHFELTETGWSFIAETVEGLASHANFR
ncbi:hypothetical protein [Mycoplana dimorpha]|uniref:Uncharacterized protein n=1 Tax=Mycoplana dimorpha TaxID=28320 RepID=A0A2T5ATV1_MYCDI|nr:hypothetical protein [Mycoplana dimorpha]PTM90139.1 hypothetical protein C7449_11019 [Mycoplana dimorpha]